MDSERLKRQLADLQHSADIARYADSTRFTGEAKALYRAIGEAVAVDIFSMARFGAMPNIDELTEILFGASTSITDDNLRIETEDLDKAGTLDRNSYIQGAVDATAHISWTIVERIAAYKNSQPMREDILNAILKNPNRSISRYELIKLSHGYINGLGLDVINPYISEIEDEVPADTESLDTPTKSYLNYKRSRDVLDDTIAQLRQLGWKVEVEFSEEYAAAAQAYFADYNLASPKRKAMDQAAIYRLV